MNRIIILLLLTSFTTLTVACGNNENNTNNENNPVDDATPDTTSGDETPDETDKDETTDEEKDETEEKTYVAETEPNDGEDDATVITIGQGGSGSIGVAKQDEDGEDVPDIDNYAIELQAGDVIKIEVDDTSAELDEGISFYFYYPEGQSPQFTIGTTSREFFAPTTGKYFISIGNGTLINEDEADDLKGGAAFTYKFSTSKRSLAPKAYTFGATEASELTGSKVESYSVTSTTAILAQFSATAVDAEALDPVMYLLDGATKEVVTFNDDIAEENFNSQFAASLDASKEYIVVIDKFSEGANQQYSLVSKELDDRFESPTALAKDTPLQGSIGAADLTANQPDLDYFELSLAADEVIRIEMAADAGSTVNPGMVLQRKTINEDGEEEFNSVALSKAVGGLAAMTYQHVSGAEDPGTYIVIVSDVKNIFPEETPDYVGGAGFDYTITAKEGTITATSATLPLSQTAPITLGDLLMYDLMLQKNDFISINVATAYPGADPVVGSVATNNQISFAGPNTTYVQKDAAGAFKIAIRDVFFLGGTDALAYAMDVSIDLVNLDSITFTEVDELDTNIDVASAQALVGSTRVKARLITDEDTNELDHPDFFSITLAQGQQVLLRTAERADAPLSDPADPASAKDNADTIITLIDASGNEVATNDETSNGDGFSALVYTAAAAGTYTVRVDAYSIDFFGTEFFVAGYYALEVHILNNNIIQ